MFTRQFVSSNWNFDRSLCSLQIRLKFAFIWRPKIYYTGSHNGQRAIVPSAKAINLPHVTFEMIMLRSSLPCQNIYFVKGRRPLPEVPTGKESVETTLFDTDKFCIYFMKELLLLSIDVGVNANQTSQAKVD